MTTVTVVGDCLLDCDLVGSAERLSPEAPVPVLTDVRRRERPGGAGLAAVLGRHAGLDVRLVTTLTDDEPGQRLLALLADAGIEVLALPGTEATAVKTRVRVGTHPVARIDEGALRDRPMRVDVPALRRMLRGSDGILASDYGRGLLEHAAVREELANAAAPLVWDPHPRGGCPIAGAALATPNVHEGQHFAASDLAARTGLDGDVSALARALLATLLGTWPVAAVCVTLGGHGAALHERGREPVLVPTSPLVVSDTCGAGDQFAMTATAALARGATPAMAVASAVDGAADFVARGAAASITVGQPSHEPSDEPSGGEQCIVASW